MSTEGSPREVGSSDGLGVWWGWANCRELQRAIDAPANRAVCVYSTQQADDDVRLLLSVESMNGRDDARAAFWRGVAVGAGKAALLLVTGAVGGGIGAMLAMIA
jgi:hypothetical protein